MSRFFVAIVLVASALAAAAPPASAASLVVCASACPYPTVQSAIDAAALGDTVVVRPGTYAENLLIDEEITVCSTTSGGGACSNNAAGTILETDGENGITITANNVVLQGFTIDNSANLSLADVSAVLVSGADGVTISDNVFAAPAAAPAAGTARASLAAIRIVASGAAEPDNVQVLRNTATSFVSSVGLGATCATCAVHGVLNAGTGSGFTLADNDIRMGDAGPRAFAVAFHQNANADILDNFLRMPSSAPGSGPDVVAIDAGVTDGALIEGNDIAVTLTSTPGGLYGIWGIFSNSELRDNHVQLAQHGIVLRTSSVGGNLVTGNHFENSNQGVLNYADNTEILDNQFTAVAGGGILLDAVDAPGGPYSSSQNALVHENVFRQTPTGLVVTDTVSNTYVNAQRNDWGVYEGEYVALRVRDDDGTNDIDYSCFIDNDGTTLVCPVPAFTIGVSGSSWPRTVTLTDTSTFPGSEFGSRLWTLPAGATSDESPLDITLSPGVHSVTLEVTDAEGFTRSLTQAVTLPNTAPSFALAASYPVAEGATLSITLGATDAEGDTLAYALLAGPSGTSIVNGVYSFTPSFAQAGSHTLTIRVGDGAASTTSTAQIVVSNTPVSPVLANIPDLSVLETHTGIRTVSATSGSGAPIVLSADDGALTGSFVDNGDGTGKYTITAPSGGIGTYPVTITAVSEGISVTKTFNVVITQSAGLTLTRASPAVQQGSPGQTVNASGTIVNTGSGQDTYVVTATNSRGWAVVLPDPIVIAAGASASFELGTTIGATGDASITAVKACSTAQPTLCKTFTVRVEVPIFVSLTMEETFGMLDEIGGRVRVTFLDGTNAPNVEVLVVQRHAQNLFLLKSEEEGTTDANGVFDFVLSDLVASAPGTHNVKATATRGAATDDATGSYVVAPA